MMKCSDKDKNKSQSLSVNNNENCGVMVNRLVLANLHEWVQVSLGVPFRWLCVTSKQKALEKNYKLIKQEDNHLKYLSSLILM